ncbi:phosphonopyruvate decarboxylase [Carboxylicivirga marina]|uniref:phosphonopyruvate decarboxylase n=1 Tax=Carboxylicivirga marina TaxID=2800988 RepID=UPI00259999EC|nr:phosphonopyruvate decarboxylase [uncultured Carboxylicivirga sp.]
MKLNTYDFGSELKELGYDFYSGVPCSFLNSLINYAINECDYVMSSNEGDAVATCAGATLAGKKSVVMMQNSGLTNATSPLTSLNYSFKLPVLGFVSLRGEPGLNDEPQHELMGTITEKFLDLMQVEWEYLSADLTIAKKQLIRANDCFENNKPFFFVVKKGTFDTVSLNNQPDKVVINKELQTKTRAEQLPRRLDVLERLSKIQDDKLVLLATTGKTGRELYEVEDRVNNFYMVGSMGSISAIGLGLAKNQPNKNVIAIDGDGALLMRMGNLATNASYATSNFMHLLIDNHMHDSTGGQATVSKSIDFVQVAANVGFQRSIFVHSLDELEQEIANWKTNPTPTFVCINASPGTKENLGRPKVKPFEVKERLINFLRDE